MLTQLVEIKTEIQHISARLTGQRGQNFGALSEDQQLQIPPLPVKTLVELNLFESWLSEGENNKQALVTILLGILLGFFELEK